MMPDVAAAAADQLPRYADTRYYARAVRCLMPLRFHLFYA